MPHDVNQSEMDVAAQVRSALVQRISSERFELWIPQATQWAFENGALRLSFPNDFACNMAKRMLAGDIVQAVEEVLGYAPDVAFEVDPSASLSTDPGISRGTQEPAVVARRGAARVLPLDRGLPLQRDSDSPAGLENAQPDPGCGQQRELWGQFVPGACNQLAWTTANIIVSDPGRLSPVVLHGPSGSGKSLLMAAIAQRLRIGKRMRRVVHMTSEQFTNDYMEGLRGGGLPMFRRKYRDVEALLLDDVQFFIGKKSTIGELRHTFDNLLRTGKQIVFTSDRGLGELQALGGELAGRLRSGMVTPLFPLDEATRSELLAQMLREAGVDIPREISEQIAHRASGDGRVLSGISKRLLAVSALRNQPLDWEQCWSAVHDLVQATQPVVRIVDIERAVCGMFGLDPTSLQSENKTRSVSQPRMLAMFLSRKYTPAAYKEIGEYFGKRRHSTVISAEKTVEAWLAENATLQVGRGLKVREAIRQVEAQLQVG